MNKRIIRGIVVFITNITKNLLITWLETISNEELLDKPTTIEGQGRKENGDGSGTHLKEAQRDPSTDIGGPELDCADESTVIPWKTEKNNEYGRQELESCQERRTR